MLSKKGFSRALKYSVLSVRQLTKSATNSQSFSSAKDASYTQQYIDTISKPFTVSTYDRPNVVITHGKGSYLYDLENKKYIDFTAGVAVTALGHSNEELRDIIAEQANTILHCSNLYYNLPAGDLANSLVTRTIASGGMKDASRVFLCNSGTEANEAALKFVKKYGRSISNEKTEIITFANSFHGRSLGSLSVTANEKYQKPFSPLIPGIKVATLNDISSVEKIISKERTCGVIVEPIQGEGGITQAEEEFLIALRKLCDENDALLIFDEIQCGLGRSGNLWAHSDLAKEAHPDILTMAKALGNGFPIGATMISEKVEQCLKVGDHGTTYGGNPLGAKIGSFVLEKVSDEHFLVQVNDKSERFLKSLNKIAQKHPEKIKAVKGRGLLLGLQFDESVKIGSIVEECRDNGLLVITAGMNVVRIVPALNIPNDLIDDGMDVLSSVIDNHLK